MLMQKNLDDSRREFLVRALTLGLFAAPGLGALVQRAHARGDIPDRLPGGRSIYRIEGDVRVDGAPANINTVITGRSLVETGSRSRIIFVVANDAFILRSNSMLQMESDAGLIIEGMRILSGRLLTVFGRREKPHTITTSTATIGVRGTGIYVESESERSYICTCYGSTRITAAADTGVSLDVVAEHHDNPVYVLPTAADGQLIVPGPFINHTDTELALIEALVGRTPPFAFAAGGYELPRKRNY